MAEVVLAVELVPVLVVQVVVVVVEMEDVDRVLLEIWQVDLVTHHQSVLHKELMVVMVYPHQEVILVVAEVELLRLVQMLLLLIMLVLEELVLQPVLQVHL